MAQDPEVKRVIAELKRTAAKARAAEVAKAIRNNAAGDAWTVADSAREAAYAAWDAAKTSPSTWDATGAALDAADAAERKANTRSQRTHYVWGEAEALACAAEYNLEAAQNCQTLADLLGSECSAVRVATQFALNPTPRDPVVERVIATLEQATDAAASVWDATNAAIEVASAACIALDTPAGDAAVDAAVDAETVASFASDNAVADFEDAWGCKTLADLAASKRPAVRAAAKLATANTPPAPKRKP